jgi:hypothetical protein
LDLQDRPLSLKICVRMFLIWKFSSFSVSDFSDCYNLVVQEKKILVWRWFCLFTLHLEIQSPEFGAIGFCCFRLPLKKSCMNFEVIPTFLSLEPHKAFLSLALNSSIACLLQPLRGDQKMQKLQLSTTPTPKLRIQLKLEGDCKKADISRSRNRLHIWYHLHMQVWCNSQLVCSQTSSWRVAGLFLYHVLLIVCTYQNLDQVY